MLAMVGKSLHNFVARDGPIADLLEINVVASIVKNVRKATAQVFGAGTIAIQLQKVTLEHGRASARVVHLLQMTLQITGVFADTPHLKALGIIKNVGKLQLDAVNVGTDKPKSQRRTAFE